MKNTKPQANERPKLKDWEWSEYWLRFTAFAIVGVVASRLLDGEPNHTTLRDFGRAYFCVAVSQLIAIHLLEKQLNGSDYMKGYATFVDWVAVNGIRALIYGAGYFFGAFILLGILNGSIGGDPRR